MKTKCLAVGIILLFVLLAGTPIPGVSYSRDDTTPPVTTISFNPPVSDGENGWYVSPVTVTLNATDNESGVNITKYRIDEAPWETYTEPVLLTNDGNDTLLEYFSIDTAGNIEPVKNATVDIDRTKPVIALTYTWEKVGNNYLIILNATCSDAMSGMDRVEFYINDVLRKTIIGPGPEYIWSYYYPPFVWVIGLIRNPEITDEYVKFYAIILLISYTDSDDWIHSYAYDNAGNYNFDGIPKPLHPAPIEPGLYLFQNMTLPNNYTGHVGRFFIRATFDNIWR